MAGVRLLPQPRRNSSASPPMRNAGAVPGAVAHVTAVRLEQVDERARIAVGDEAPRGVGRRLDPVEHRREQLLERQREDQERRQHGRDGRYRAGATESLDLWLRVTPSAAMIGIQTLSRVNESSTIAATHGSSQRRPAVEGEQAERRTRAVWSATPPAVGEREARVVAERRQRDGRERHGGRDRQPEAQQQQQRRSPGSPRRSPRPRCRGSPGRRRPAPARPRRREP